MFTYTNTTALITGASSGIGLVFAQELAQRGCNLVLAARSEDKLQALAASLRERHNVRIEVARSDLAQPGAAQALYAESQARGMVPGLLINNAGFGTHGYFEQLPLERQREEILLNVLATVELTHVALPAMLAQKRGGIINVASTAAFQPDPYMAVYGATKAFVLSWSEALWEENRRRGVRVVALAPGATATAFFDVVGTGDAAVGAMAKPEDVVALGLRALERGKSSVIHGRQNYWMAQSNRLAPRALVARIAGSLLRPK